MATEYCLSKFMGTPVLCELWWKRKFN